MDGYSELALSSLDWLTGTPGAVFVVLAALPLLWLIIQLRGISLLAIALLAGGIALLWQGAEELGVAMMLLSLGSLLIAIDTSVARRRLVRFENSLNATVQSVRALEVAEERRQGFIARHQPPYPIAPEERGAAPPEVAEAHETAPQ